MADAVRRHHRPPRSRSSAADPRPSRPTLRRAAVVAAVVAAAIGLAAHGAAADATGFFVSREGHFVSANHVLGKCVSAAIKTPGGILIGDLVAHSADADLAVVKTRERPRHWARLPKDPARALQSAVLIARFSGSADPDARRLTPAEFEHSDPSREGFLIFRASATIRSGDSGSPVISQHGAVVGVLVARDRQRSYLGIAADAFALAQLLHGAGIRFETVGETAALRIGTDPENAGRFAFPVSCVK